METMTRSSVIGTGILDPQFLETNLTNKAINNPRVVQRPRVSARYATCEIPTKRGLGILLALI